MLQFTNKIRVRYAETDKMGFVYYGNYATYFEVARVEFLRSMGLSYKSVEDSGIIMPVLEFGIKYFKPAYYDDELLIKTTIKEMPAMRLTFYHETFNQNDICLNKAHVTLAIVNSKTGKPCHAPNYFVDALKSNWHD
ncbi:MAG: acyl-CoA thioesterase [Bacteroidia bacterium]|nr:acyl-CoA thioesterase [Bacteroidia bacterium]